MCCAATSTNTVYSFSVYLFLFFVFFLFVRSQTIAQLRLGFTAKPLHDTAVSSVSCVVDFYTLDRKQVNRKQKRSK